MSISLSICSGTASGEGVTIIMFLGTGAGRLLSADQIASITHLAHCMGGGGHRTTTSRFVVDNGVLGVVCLFFFGRISFLQSTLQRG